MGKEPLWEFVLKILIRVYPPHDRIDCKIIRTLLLYLLQLYKI